MLNADMEEEQELLPKSTIIVPINDRLPQSETSVTPVVVFSTFVAICGSFGTGCAVSNLSFHRIIYVYFLFQLQGSLRLELMTLAHDRDYSS